MGFINLGTVNTTSIPNVVNYGDIRTVNCDDIIRVEAEIIGIGFLSQLNIRIAYKFSQESTFLVETEDRRMKSWITGSVGGAYTDTLDAMTVSFLSERCLVTQAANNFVLFKGA